MKCKEKALLIIIYFSLIVIVHREKKNISILFIYKRKIVRNHYSHSKPKPLQPDIGHGGVSGLAL